MEFIAKSISMKKTMLKWLNLASLLVAANTLAQIPRYELDLQWPQVPMRGNWLTGGIGGMCIDRDDHVFLLNRQNVVGADLDGAELAPPIILNC